MSKKKNKEVDEIMERRKNHTFCKETLSERRKKYKCSQDRITALRGVNSWDIFIDPEGAVGSFSGCCKWEAMIKALDSKFIKHLNSGLLKEGE